METWEEFLAAQDWDSSTQNAAAFWVAYVLGAFQGESPEDSDPDTEEPTEGETGTARGGSLIYLEVNKDFARQPPPSDPTVEEQDTVVHEVGHAVGRSISESPPVTRYAQGTPSRYTEWYLMCIRSAVKPWSS